MIINHGVPKHKFFAIAVPLSVVPSTIDSKEPGYIKPIHTLVDPNTGEKTEAEVQETATLTLAEFINVSIPSLLAYGIPSKPVANELQRRFPEIKKTQQVRYVVFREL